MKAINKSKCALSCPIKTTLNRLRRLGFSLRVTLSEGGECDFAASSFTRKNQPNSIPMNTSNPIVLDPNQSHPVQSRRPGLPCLLMRRWCGLLLSSVFLLMVCGSASAQLVNVLGWTNGILNFTANVGTITTFESGLDANANVLVVGLYGDNSSTYGAVTFGGIAPNGFMNVSAVGESRSAVAYWINPNTAAGQDLVVNYTSPNPGYYWAYQLSGVNTNVPVLQSGANTSFATTTSLTTTNYNTLIISYFSVNNAAAAGINSLTPNPPLIQCDVTRRDAAAGASMSSATNSIFLPGLQTISWNALNPPGTASRGLAALGFVAGQPGAPGVIASVNPPGNASSLNFTVTATIYPGIGSVTNVSVDLSPIGEASVNNLVQSSNPNVWTNTFMVPGGAPIGPTSLTVTATQDTAPLMGSGPLKFTVLEPAPPTIVQDTSPTNLFFMYVGQGVRFSATFTGPGSITNQWQFSPDVSTYTDIPGATNYTYTLSSANPGDTGAYQLQASDSFGSSLSTYTYVTVYDATPALYLWSAPISFAGLTAEQILTNFPSANKIAGAMVAQNGGSPITVVLTNANNQPVVFAGAGNWASLSGGTLYSTGINTNKSGNTSFDSVLNRGYSGTAASPNNFQTLALSGLGVGKQYQVQLFALNDQLASPAYVNFADPLDANQITSQTFGMADNAYELGTFTATNAVMTVQVNMPSTAGTINSVVLRTVGWDPPPYFTLQPANTQGFLGTNVALTGSAAADATIANPAIAYQWAAGPAGGTYTDLVEGNKYAGVTTTTLTISNLVSSDGGVVYVLRATDSGGTATSREATLLAQSPLVLPPANSFGGAVLALTTNRLVGFWQLNETNDPSTGLLVAIDASTNKHSGKYGTSASNAFTGVLAPQPPLYAGFATNQGALRTAAGGTGDANSIVSLPPLNATNGVNTTICMWINPSAVAPANAGLIYNRSSVDQCGIQFGGTTGGDSGQRNLTAFWANANGEATYNFNTGLFPANNTWNFIVLVVRTNAMTYYLNYVDANGVAHLQKSADTASRYTQQQWGGTTGTPIWIGGDPGGPTVFPGSIANVAMFNSALTDDQISTLFSAGFQSAGFPAGFTQQPPATQTNYTGYTAQIIAQTGGSSPITNQWMFNGINLVDGWMNGSIITGSKSNVLTIQNVSSNWNGVYNLAITNAISGTVSSNSTLTIVTPAAPPAENLVGRWLAGAQNLTDVSGYLPGMHDGSQIMTNGVARGVLIWTNDLPPNAASGGYSLYITNTGIQINNTSTNDAGYEATFDAGISNAMTLTFWAKGWPGQWNPFVSKYGETTPSPAGGWQFRNDGGNNLSPCWTIRGNPGTVALGTAVGGNAEDTAATSLTYGNDGKWHFYCATYDVTAGQRMIYVDGSLVAYTTGQGQYTTVPLNHLVIGARDSGGTNGYTGYFNGKIYDVRIYNTAISDSQQASLAAPPPLPPLKISASVTPASGGNPGQMVLSWLNGGWLLQSTNVAGPWLTNQAATPPYTILTTNTPAEFYKVLFP
jgi:hypothetical protein